MKLHTDMLTENDVFHAKEETVDAGLMASHVHFDKLNTAGSRTRGRAFEVHFSSDIKIKGDKRGRTNSGNMGAGGAYAATYDEWGHFIARVFDKDPDAVFGPYKGEQHFHETTRYKYAL